jgi:hypothetical protein
MTHTKYTNTWQTDEWYRMILKLQRYRHLLSEKDERILTTISNKIPDGLR